MANGATVIASGRVGAFGDFKEVNHPGGESRLALGQGAVFGTRPGRSSGWWAPRVGIAARRVPEEVLQAGNRELGIRLDALPQMVWSIPCDSEGHTKRWMGAYTGIEDRKQVEADLSDALGAGEIPLQEVNHRVRNGLQLVISLPMPQEPPLRQALMEARGRLCVVASMHQRLPATSRHDRVDVGDYLRDMATDTNGKRC